MAVAPIKSALTVMMHWLCEYCVQQSIKKNTSHAEDDDGVGNRDVDSNVDDGEHARRQR